MTCWEHERTSPGHMEGMSSFLHGVAIVAVSLIALNVGGLVMLGAVRGHRRRRTDRAFAADTVPDSWVRAARRQDLNR